MALAKGYPNIAQISLTNKCQCNCAHCGVQDVNRYLKQANLDLYAIKQIVDQFEVFGIQVIGLFGGEPTLREDIMEIISYIKDKKMMVAIESNGIKLSKEYLLQLKKLDVNLIYISLDDYRVAVHDGNRKYDGAHDQVTKAVKLCKELGIPCHTSVVPDADYFTSGQINNYLEYCKDIGAEKTRIIFPIYIGNLLDVERSSQSVGKEMDLLKFIDKKHTDFVYIDALFSPLREVLEGREFGCSAKEVFFHVAASGVVFPCPYVPLVFGDIMRESVLNIVEKIQDHPIINVSQKNCVGRNEIFLSEYRDKLSKENPYHTMECINRIFIGEKCSHSCTVCQDSVGNVDILEIKKQINEIDSRYANVHFFGELLGRKDCFDILNEVPDKFGIVLNSSGKEFSNTEVLSLLSKYRIRRINILLLSAQEKEHNILAGDQSYSEVIKIIAALCKAGFSVSIFLKKNKIIGEIKHLINLGVKSIEQFDIDSEFISRNQCPLYVPLEQVTSKLLWLDRMK